MSESKTMHVKLPPLPEATPPETPQTSEYSTKREDSSEILEDYTPKWDEPPKSMLSRIGRRNLQRQNTYNHQFISLLRRSFEESDTDHREKLDLEQWSNSSIRHIIHDGNLTDEEYINYFKRIDANKKGKIKWSELVQYLMKEIASVDLGKSTETARFITKAPTALHPRVQQHRDMVTRISISHRTGEYITLSNDSIRFWTPSDLSFNRAIIEPGLFNNMLVFENISVLGVTTTNRRLIFFSLENLFQLPVEMSASPSSKKIHAMTRRDALDALKVLESPQMPLFNIPSTMAMADMLPTDPGTVFFFIGDDNGVIEVFKLIAPKRRQGLDYSLERVGRHNYHSNAITQITCLNSLSCYASSSLDHTIKFWTYFPQTNQFKHIRTFTDDQPITCFNFSEAQKVLTTCGISRDAFVWSLSPPRKIFKLGGHYNQVTMITDYITTTGEKYLLTMTTKKEFRLWDALNYRMIREFSDPLTLRPENHYSCALFDYKRFVLITACGDVYKWAEDISALNECLELHTHSHHIVGAFLVPEFQQMVSVDSISTIKVWNIETGTNASNHSVSWAPENSDIATCSLDCTQRRLITSSFKNNVQMWNYNSGLVMADLDIKPKSALITIIKTCTINGRDYLIQAGWDRTITLYTETELLKFEMYREFQAHTTDITAVAYHTNGIVSGSNNGEIYSWSLDTNTPVSQFQLDSEATIECIGVYGGYVFAGDANGILHVISLHRLNLQESRLAHSIYVPHSISALTYDEKNQVLYTADTLGYVKSWSLTFGDDYELEEKKIYRCHNDEITSLIVLFNGDFIATCGIDLTIRVWKAETFEYLGFFSEESHWSLEDETTWVGKSPFEPEEKHFAHVIKKLSTNLTSVRSLRMLPSIMEHQTQRGDPTTRSQEDKSSDEEAMKPYNFIEVGRAIEEYTNVSHIKAKPKSTFEEIEMDKENYEPPQLATSTRPVDLISTIGTLITRQPQTDFSRRKKVSSSMSQAKAHIIRAPIVVGSKKRATSRLPKYAFTSPFL